MTIGVNCGSCSRQLLLAQLLQPSQGFRCPFCGFAFAPAYATVAPGVATRIMVAHAALITSLAELQSMTADRLRLDQATVVDPIANALPAVEADAEQPAPIRRRRAHRWPRLVALPRTTQIPRPQR